VHKKANSSTLPYFEKARVAVLGARGYSGLELCRLLLSHPHVQLVAAAGSGAKPGWKLADELPEDSSTPTAQASTVANLSAEQVVESASTLDVVFLATPAEISMEFAPRFLRAGCSVIDLSGAFRLPAPEFEKAYGIPHSAPELLEQASYGLVPWAEPVPTSKPCKPYLIANPGCYVTAALMALIPLLRAGVLDERSIVIDGKSGTTGAGRKASPELLFSELAGEFYPYKVGRHQHLPEIQRHAELLGKLEKGSFDPHFTTHLLPIPRGISLAIYARLKPGFDATEISRAIGHLYDRAYAGYPLFAHGAADSPDSARRLSLRRVTGTPRTQVSYAVQGDKLYLFSLIDNLLKGAASQAIENLNRAIL
jgi:N-acetyl-gamma-glutamyl-phosphate reductase